MNVNKLNMLIKYLMEITFAVKKQLSPKNMKEKPNKLFYYANVSFLSGTLSSILFNILQDHVVLIYRDS